MGERVERLEAVSQGLEPQEDAVQAGQFGEGAEEVGVALMADQQPPVVVHPGDGVLDFPAFAVAPQDASVLTPRTALATVAVRTDQPDAVLPQPVALRGPRLPNYRTDLLEETGRRGFSPCRAAPLCVAVGSGRPAS